MIKAETKSKKTGGCYLCGDPLPAEPAKIQFKDGDKVEEHEICNVCEYICERVTLQNESFNMTIEDE